MSVTFSLTETVTVLLISWHETLRRTLKSFQTILNADVQHFFSAFCKYFSMESIADD